jgi:hypothetical protein
MVDFYKDFLELLNGGGDGGDYFGGGGGGRSEVQSNNGTLAIVPVITNANSATPPSDLPVNYQILPEGFGSYLQGILPDDVAVAAGAFSATMQQIKNVRKLDIEKFAQVVASLETTAGLNLVNGTNIPVDSHETLTGLTLVALGSGPFGTYTYSDFFGCMSGLTYDWVGLQTAITNMPTGNLATIYSNLYAATQGPALGLDAAVQAQIDLANAEIAILITTHPGQAGELNDLWNTTADQLNVEQRARNTGLSPIPSPRTGDLFPYPTMIYSFTDNVPVYAKLTDSNMAAQTLEAISNLELIAGQSIVAAMRSERNQARLLQVGIPLDDNIPDVVPSDPAVIASDPGAPSYPFNVVPVDTPEFFPESSVAGVLGIGTPGGLPAPSPNIGIGTPGISQVSINLEFFQYGSPLGGGPIVPGSLAGSPYTKLIPPALNPIYTSNVLLPASISVPDAIEQVILCNCDCWIQ